MIIKILTLFPNFFESFINSSIIGRAISREVVQFEIIDIRKYSTDKNHRVDDRPLGGGAVFWLSAWKISCRFQR